MQPQTSHPPTSISSRDCPVCGEPVHWSRYWLRAWALTKWSCPKCRSLLGFDRNRRWLTAIPVGLAAGLYEFMQSRYSALVALPVLFVGAAATGLLDRVTVVANRNTRYCATCRYDLTGTLRAGIGRCPECGREIASEQLAAMRPDA